MTYEQAIATISSLQNRGWRLGLDRMNEFLRRADLTGALGTGPDSPAFIHVAGTNGKGSTTAFTQSLLRAQGYTVGGFFSPFVYDIRERVQLNCENISRDDLARMTERLLPAAQSLESTDFDGPTEFEFKTALGFAFWQEQRCDWVALETGLGGRLDATNVVTPRCSVITSIGWDHMAILGPTLGAIAAEKAGILKPGAPVVLGALADEPREVILARAHELGCPVHALGTNIEVRASGEGWVVTNDWGTFGPVQPGIRGCLAPENFALALTAVFAAGALRDPAQIAAGAREARAPGRFQIVEVQGVRVILDGAHNVDAAVNLRHSLEGEQIEDVICVTHMLQGHEPEPFYAALKERVRRYHVAPVQFFRASDPQQLAANMRASGHDAIAHQTLLGALEAALAEAGPGGTVLVTGSFYLVGEVGLAIGLGDSGASREAAT